MLCMQKYPEAVVFDKLSRQIELPNDEHTTELIVAKSDENQILPRISWLQSDNFYVVGRVCFSVDIMAYVSRNLHLVTVTENWNSTSTVV